MRNSKNVQSFLASFLAMRSGIGWVHSNCLPVSKCTHCLQQCNSVWQRGHSPLGSNPGIKTAPQLEHRALITVPTIRGVRGPIISCFGRGSPLGRESPFERSPLSLFLSSDSRSLLPLCLYFRSIGPPGGCQIILEI